MNNDEIVIKFDIEKLNNFLKAIYTDYEGLKYEGFRCEAWESEIYEMLCNEVTNYYKSLIK